MNCEQFKNIAYDLAVGELSPEERAEAERHMEGCPECREEFDRCVKLAEALRSMGEVEPPADLLGNVMREISPPKRSVGPRIIRFGTAAAAAVLLAAGVITVAPTLYRDGNEPDVAPISREVEPRTAKSRLYDGGGETDTVTEADTAVPETAQAPENTAETAADESTVGTVTEEITAEPEVQPDSSEVITAEPEQTSTEPVTEPVQAVPEPEPQRTVPETADTQPEPVEAADEPSVASIQPLDEVVSGAAVMAGGAVESHETGKDAEQIEEGVMAYSGGGGGGGSSSSGGSSGSSGGGGGGSSAGAVPRISDSGIAANSVEEAETSYVSRIIEFRVSAAYAETAAQVETEGKTMAQVEAELKALEIPYAISITDEDYTEEYKTASQERRAEIEQLCLRDRCEITYEEG